jgi:nitrogen fixation protein FixH
MSAGTRWILIVIGLLVGNAIAVVVLIGSAGGTSGRVLPDYYDRAAAWDDTMAEAARSSALGWQVQTQARGRTVEVTLRDRAGAPLTGAAVSLRGFPRGNVDATAALDLVATGPGQYRGEWPGAQGGLHDVTIVATRGGDRWIDRRIVELTAGAVR